MKKLLGSITAAALVSACMLALPVLAAPQPGVYQQMNADGRLKSTVTILHNPGTSDYMAMQGIGDSTYICMEALDNNGMEVEEYAVKYDPDGASVYGFTINAENLRKCEQNVSFTVEANKKNNAVFSFPQEDKLVVAGAGSQYDGEYHFSPRSEIQANSALLVYAYEVTKKPHIAYEGSGVAASYQVLPLPKAPWLNTLQVIDKGEEKSVLLDNGLNIVMEVNQQGNFVYKPFFVSHNYLEWAKNGLQVLKEDVNGNFGSLYVHQYLAQNYPDLTRNNNIRLKAVDFYGGEGENAVFTRVYELETFVDGELYISGDGTHSDNGRMIFKQYIGQKRMTGDEVRLRQKPNTDCEVLGYVNKGDVVKVLGLTRDKKWAAVSLPNSGIGFVSAQFVAGL